MEPYEQSNLDENNYQDANSGSNGWMRPVLVALLVLAGIAVAYGLHERSQVQQLKSQAAATSNSMSQLQAQVNDLQSKLSNLSTVQTPAQVPTSASSVPSPASEGTPPAAETSAEPAAPAPAPALTATAAKPAAAKHTAAKHRTTATDKRYSQLKSQLDEQQKELKDAQDQIAKNRADLEGSIGSTRDELNGSIAKTHEELVALEKRGERSYFEFELTKSKQYQRFGPLTLSLRKVDTKHKNYDLAMIVDDNELNKKKVNLYEPIWIHTENGTQPIQVVVNRIDKNVVHGYVSAPKYKASDLAALSSSATPASNASPSAQTQGSAQPQ